MTQEQINKLIDDIYLDAQKIKEDYIRAYFADECLSTKIKPNIRDYELVEQRQLDKGIITFYIRKRLGRKRTAK